MNKKKKKLKADSDLSEQDLEDELEPKRVSSRKSRKVKEDEPVDLKPVEDKPVEDRPPTVAEVCKSFGLNDVQLVIWIPEMKE